MFVSGISKYFLLNNGTDTPTCGAEADTACATLQYLLEIFRLEHKGEFPTLEIIHDMPLLINKTLMVCVFSFALYLRCMMNKHSAISLYDGTPQTVPLTVTIR